MKTKLLKIVRKRYSIERIDKMLNHSSEFFKEAKNRFGLPFYVVTDKNENLRDPHKTFEQGRKALCCWINCDYINKIKNKKPKSSKVWWINKTKDK